MLLQASMDYIGALKSGGQNNTLLKRYTEILSDFILFATHKGIPWENIFTFETFREFRKYTNLGNTSHALIGLSGYLHENGKVADPLRIPNYQVELPEVYEHYFLYLQQTREISQSQVNSIRRMMASLHDYLDKHKINLDSVKIEHLDAFMGEFKVAKTTLKTYRHHVRGFLRYLYHERNILKEDLAPLLVGAPVRAHQKPPRFLRPREIQRLFSSLKLSTPVDIRTYAMIHLAYTLGLRPIEISKITLDHISFSRGQLTIKERKAQNPTILPLSRQTLKALAAYVFKARPQTELRALFLTHTTPHSPVRPGTVIGAIRIAMKEAGLPSSAYWLRHTYAQNLLGMGRSIYEIKEMMGHGNIQSTQRYLYIDLERMRKVLLDETL